MTPYDLELFLSLCRSLNFHRASQESYIAPSTLSRAIQRLEAAAGAPLFNRDRQRVELTPAGIVFRDYARESLSAWQTVRTRMASSDQGLQGRLRLFCTVTASYSILPDLLPGFMQQEPGVRLELETGDADDALPKVLDGAADLAVAVLPEQLPSALETRVVARTSIVCIAPANRGPVASLLDQRPLPWSEIPLAVPESGPVRESFLGWIAGKGAVPRITGTVSGHEAILALVNLGLAVGAIPKLVLERSLFASQVQVIKLRPGLPHLRIGLCVHRQRLDDPCVRAFWDSLDTPPE